MGRFVVRLVVVLFVMTLAFGQPATAATLNEWTIMCYFAGDEGDKSELSNAQIRSISELADKAGSPGNYEFVVQMDPSKDSKLTDAQAKGATVRLEPGTNGRWTIAQELGEMNMGSPHALWDFLKWSVAKHPAKRYALIIGGHGSGIFSWHGTGHVSSTDPGKVIFDPSRFVAYDGTDQDCLTLFEIQAVLAAFRDRLTGGRPLDMLVFDTCLPGALEMLYQLRDLTNLVVSSPSTTLIGGMPYPFVAGYLRKNPAIADTILAKNIAEAYISRAIALGGRREIMAVYRTAPVQRLVVAFDRVAQAFIQVIKETGKGPRFEDVTSFGKSQYYYDLKRILTEIINGKCDFRGASNESDTRDLAKKALKCLDECHFYTCFSSDLADEKLGGLSVAWPGRADYKDFQKFYKVLDFAKATHWDEYLDARLTTEKTR